LKKALKHQATIGVGRTLQSNFIAHYFHAAIMLHVIYRFTTLMSDLQEVGAEICRIAELFNFQHGIMDQTLTDLITDYNGIILTIPVGYTFLEK